mmetsp:Transcript_114206/g.160227  ORF Transcript_114206/g.160227 Transcript_114206/m.160227 type:complete len:80 (+) Transcript_114206:45-284(+)|eukprot:s2023_g12.t1
MAWAGTTQDRDGAADRRHRCRPQFIDLSGLPARKSEPTQASEFSPLGTPEPAIKLTRTAKRAEAMATLSELQRRLQQAG